MVVVMTVAAAVVVELGDGAATTTAAAEVAGLLLLCSMWVAGSYGYCRLALGRGPAVIVGLCEVLE